MNTKEYNITVDKYADLLYRFVVKNVKDEDVAKDVIQDAFEKLWLKIGDVQFEKVKSYLFTTAYHTMIDQIRTQKRIEKFKAGYETISTHSENYSDLNDILNEAIDKLPDNQKAVILLRDYEGYSYEEIGKITKLSTNQVKVYIFRARKYLKKYISRIDLVL